MWLLRASKDLAAKALASKALAYEKANADDFARSSYKRKRILHEKV